MSDERRGAIGRLGELYRSFSVRFVLLVVIFLAVPFLVYQEFRDADAQKIALLRQNTGDEGRLIADALKPLMRDFTGATASALSKEVRRLVRAGTIVRLLYRPADPKARQGLFLIASAPDLEAPKLEVERARLIDAGIFTRVDDACEVARYGEARYVNVSGNEEVLTSMTPVRQPSGCWIVLVSKSTDVFLRSSLGRPYWQSTEVRIAGLIYLLFAGVVLSMFVDIWRNLHRFAGLARIIRIGDGVKESFRAQNRVPEFSGIAREFDRLVLGLRASAKSIREAAEENAHALKGPIAVINQSMVPVRRAIGGMCDAGRALDRIERSTERLDRLVNASRQLDNAMAELIEAPRERIALSALVRSMAMSFARNYEGDGPRISTEIDDGVVVWGSVLLFETAIENIIENAISFSPPGGTVSIGLKRGRDAAKFVVADQGPGVDEGDLERIFERYFTNREFDADSPAAESDVPHFGIGLWIVRRNLEAVGGRVVAENGPDGGLRLTATIPLAGA